MLNVVNETEPALVTVRSDTKEILMTPKVVAENVKLAMTVRLDWHVNNTSVEILMLVFVERTQLVMYKIMSQCVRVLRATREIHSVNANPNQWTRFHPDKMTDHVSHHLVDPTASAENLTVKLFVRVHPVMWDHRQIVGPSVL
jgi:hypothetical protein